MYCVVIQENVGEAVCIYVIKLTSMKTGGKKCNPTLPYLLSQGWNAGKGDCGHYCSQLGFCINRHRDTEAACRKEEQALSRMEGIQGRNLG